ncbi:phenoloxidase-activating factor 2-like [Drosophila ficusphila]|uniref:phenoloxidase-activating factor 2-like n=1 Tax=Drosophila ficusphila TaxID=30025 RepID=UPI001C89E568|nr:phenoloxidase-activating factor 2-like [Drosophila ficusphila]
MFAAKKQGFNADETEVGVKVTVSQEYAREGQFPWTVVLFKNGRFLGGGSLISERVVLTAAHLLVDISKEALSVRAGEWDLASASETVDPEERNVSSIELHEGFRYSNGVNNIALLYLDRPFELNDFIRPICLANREWPSRPNRPNHPSRPDRCQVAGWGKRSFSDPHHSNIKRQVKLPLVDRESCQCLLRRTPQLGQSFELPENMICAGGEYEKDACVGDGGSSLFCSLDGEFQRYEQIGIVGWGVKCGQQDVPAPYTDVSKFRDWIDRSLARHCHEPLIDCQYMVPRKL